jgi:hypothetical protein
MSQKKDWTGQKFGKLTFVKPTNDRIRANIVWELLCDCGETTYKIPRSIVLGAIKSCGCLQPTHAKNLFGKKFGRLTFIQTTSNISGRAVWEILCDCGKTIIDIASPIVSGHKKSCGCLGAEHKKDWSGQKFNFITLLSKSEKKNSYGTNRWNAICDCGETMIVSPYNVANGHTKSCGCIRLNYGENWEGQKFNRLTLISAAPNEKSANGAIMWNAKCECGNTTIVAAVDVARGKTKSCGCSTKEIWEQSGKNLSIMNTKYSPIESTAHIVWRANYQDGCSFELFFQLSQERCHYCGREPFLTWNRSNKSTTNNRQKEEGNFTYNGLDRVDSSKGHSPDNIVPCCWACNRMKGAMPVYEFLAHIERISSHQNTKKDILQSKVG